MLCISNPASVMVHQPNRQMYYPGSYRNGENPGQYRCFIYAPSSPLLLRFPVTRSWFIHCARIPTTMTLYTSNFVFLVHVIMHESRGAVSTGCLLNFLPKAGVPCKLMKFTRKMKTIFLRATLVHWEKTIFLPSTWYLPRKFTYRKTILTSQI